MSNSSTAEPEHDFRATLLRHTSRMPNGRHKQPRSSLTDDFMRSSNTTSKIGAVFYIIWACLHLLATYSVYVLGRSLDSSMVQGRVFQDAWNLLFFSIDYAMSNRSRFITLFQAATKSLTNFFSASELA